MDPATPLDHALFHLTPTRTRCDLLVVPLGKAAVKEKIASGLLEPFLAHLRSAREQIPKGGYSFTLRPLREGNGHGGANKNADGWFTKGTLERFVRFVATPEILERVVTIENEIVQIEESIHREDANSSNHHIDRDAAASLAIVPVVNGTAKHANSSKSTDEHDKQDAANGENSRVCLLRALESRKTILYKEQGMAYARASVAGFDRDTIDDLISFADAFGATRLREACINFLEVCKEKEKDKTWMDELAALEASRQSQLSYLGASGIMLTADNNENSFTTANSIVDGHQGQNGSNEDSVSNPAANGIANGSWNQGHFTAANVGNHNFPMGWPNHPPFPGYAFPGMPFMQPYPGYSDGSQWPGRNDDERSQVRGKSGKLHRSSETALSSRDNYSDNDNSNPESESDEKDISTDVDSSRKSQRHKKSNKKSSRMVVIRNINYITSKGKHEENDSSDKSSTDDVLDGDFLRRKVEDIVGSLEKHDSTAQHHKKKGEQRNPVTKDLRDADDIDTNHDNANKTSNQGWDAFQNILLREEPDATAEYGMMRNGDIVSPSGNNQFDGEYKKSVKPKTVAVDPIAGTWKNNGFEGSSKLENFEHDENYRRYMRRSQNTDEELLFSQRGKDNSGILSGVPYTEESFRLKGHSEGDWYLMAESGRKGDISTSRDSLFVEDNQVQKMKDQHVNKEKLDVAVDDSFIAPVRAVVTEKQPFSLWETDMSIISGVASGGDGTHLPTNSKENNGNSQFHEPEELQLMLGRSLEVEQFTTSWTPEIDYSASIANKDASEKDTPIEESPSADNKLSSNGKDARSKLKPAISSIKSNVSSKTFSKNKLEALSRPRAVSSLSKRGVVMSKAEKEEAERKRVEEQLLERQRRIAQRSTTNPTTSVSRQNSVGAKSAVASPKQEKKFQGSQPTKQNGLGHSMKLNRQTQVKV